jgi:tetratricopeptide (TPR) repeat protein
LRPRELLGDTLMALERYGRAAAHYEAYLRLDDRDARVLYKLGLAWLHAGRPDTAVPSLGRALRLAEDDAQTHYVLGVCLAEMGHLADAVRSLEQAVALAPAFIDARHALARLYRQQGRTADEVRQLEAVAAIGPARVASRMAIADAWMRAHRIDRAVATLVHAIELDPNDPDLLVALAQVWLTAAEERNDGQFLQKAVGALRRAESLGATSGALTLLGRAQVLSGDVAGAKASLSRATSVLPVDARAFADLATAAERLQQWSVARDALLQQAALDGNQVTAAARAERARRLRRIEQLLAGAHTPQRVPRAASPARGGETQASRRTTAR